MLTHVPPPIASYVPAMAMGRLEFVRQLALNCHLPAEDSSFWTAPLRGKRARMDFSTRALKR